MKNLKLQEMSKADLIAEVERFREREIFINATEKLAQVGHYKWDYSKNRLEYCSEEYARICGFTVSEVMAFKSTWEKTLRLIHPDDLDQYLSVISAQRNTGGALDFRYRIIRRDGQVRRIREIGLIDANENIDGPAGFGILQDITELTKHEQELEYRDALTQQAEEMADLGYFIFDLDAESYFYISPGFGRIHGVSCEAYMEKVNSRDDDMADVHVNDYERLYKVYSDHRKNGGSFSVEYRMHRSDGEIRWIREFSKLLIWGDSKRPQSIGVLQDITSQKSSEEELSKVRAQLEKTVQKRTSELADTVNRLEEEIVEREKIAAELKFLANHDALTGLPSLRLCKDRLERSLIESRRSQKMTAVMFIDLDGFKAVNDTYGHEFGDGVLRTTAGRIKAVIRELDTVARIGGDEFIIIMSSVPDAEIVQRVAANLIEQVSQVIQVNQIEVSVGASLGIALYPEDGTTSDELIRRADSAMYQVKNSGKNNFRFYRPERLN